MLIKTRSECSWGPIRGFRDERLRAQALEPDGLGLGLSSATCYLQAPGQVSSSSASVFSYVCVGEDSTYLRGSLWGRNEFTCKMLRKLPGTWSTQHICYHCHHHYCHRCHHGCTSPGWTWYVSSLSSNSTKNFGKDTTSIRIDMYALWDRMKRFHKYQ